MTERRFRTLLFTILAFAAILRFVWLGADPPLELSRSNAEVMDAGWYLAPAVDAAQGLPTHVEDQYRKPVITAVARAFFWLGGISLASAHAMAAMFGVLLVLFGALGARAASGNEAGILAALFLATSFVLVGYSRTPVVYGPMSAGLAVAFYLDASGRRAAALAVVAIVALGIKAGAVALVPGLIAGHVVASPRPWRTLAIGAGAALLAVAAVFLLARPTFMDVYWKVGMYLGKDAGPLDVLVRTLASPFTSGFATRSPGIFLGGIAGAIVLARRANRPAVVLATWLAAVFLVHGPFTYARQEGQVPIRHFAQAAIPAGILAAGLLAQFGTRAACAVAALVVAIDAGWLATAAAHRTYTVRAANDAVARTIPTRAVIEGPWAHALTYDFACERRDPQRLTAAPDVTHLIVDAAYPEQEAQLRAFLATRGIGLERVLSLRVRGYPVAVYRYAREPLPQPPGPDRGDGGERQGDRGERPR